MTVAAIATFTSQYRTYITGDFLANGLTWLVLLLWSELFKLVGITFSKRSFATDGFIYLTLGLVTALAVILARTQSRLIDSIQSCSR